MCGNGIEPFMEKDLAKFIKNNPDFIEEGLVLVDEEITCPIGRIDALWRDKNENIVVIEYKRTNGSDKAIGQLARYMGWVQQEYNTSNVRGIIICKKASEKLRLAATINSNITIKEFGGLKNPDIIDMSLFVEKWEKRLQEIKKSLFMCAFELNIILDGWGTDNTPSLFNFGDLLKEKKELSLKTGKSELMTLDFSTLFDD